MVLACGRGSGPGVSHCSLSSGRSGGTSCAEAKQLQLETSRIMDDPQRKWLLVCAFYIIAVPVCSGIPLVIPQVVWFILWTGYPLWFVVWIAALCWTLSKLGRLYRQTSTEMWGWLSVPYSVALPALPLALLVASSVLWALTTILLMLRKRTARISTKLMLWIIPVGALLWITVLNKNLVVRLW